MDYYLVQTLAFHVVPGLERSSSSSYHPDNPCSDPIPIPLSPYSPDTARQNTKHEQTNSPLFFHTSNIRGQQPTGEQGEKCMAGPLATLS